jgi:hypothetical protein
VFSHWPMAAPQFIQPEYGLSSLEVALQDVSLRVTLLQHSPISQFWSLKVGWQSRTKKNISSLANFLLTCPRRAKQCRLPLWSPPNMLWDDLSKSEWGTVSVGAHQWIGCTTTDPRHPTSMIGWLSMATKGGPKDCIPMLLKVLYLICALSTPSWFSPSGIRDNVRAAHNNPCVSLGFQFSVDCGNLNSSSLLKARLLQVHKLYR